MIHRKLYRGDSDKNGDRNLKHSLRERMLFTNLISSGNGQEIFTNSLIELVKRHINPGWCKTHFLSFSECENKALEFGSFGLVGEHYPCDDFEASWHFAMLTLDTTNLHVCTLKESGVYECSYDPSVIEFKNGCRIALIDTVEYLKANSQLDTASQLTNAERDKEWLLLPINAILLNNNMVEFTAKLYMLYGLLDYELFEVK